MADKKISQLTDGGVPQSTDEFVIDRAGTDNFKLDFASIKAAAEATVASDLAAHIADPTDAHDASAISNVPSGIISATDVQAAIDELAGEIPASLAGAVILAPTTDGRNVIQPTAATVLPLTLKGAAAQTEDLLQVQDSTSAILARLNERGFIGVGVDPEHPIDAYRAVTAPAAGALTQILGGVRSVVDLTSPAAFVSGNTVYLNDFEANAVARADTQGLDHLYVLRAAGTINAPTVVGGDNVSMTAVRATSQNVLGSTWPVDFVEGVAVIVSNDASASIGRMFGVTVAAFTNGQVTTEVNEFQAGYGEAYGAVTHPLWRGMLIAPPTLDTASDIVTQYYGIDIFDNGVFASGVFTNFTGLRIRNPSQTVSGQKIAIQVDASAGKSIFNEIILVGKTSAPADAEFSNSQGGWWWDQANSLPKWKGKTSGGVVVNLSPYVVGGTDVALADGGTGASLTDPNADRIMFWDDSAGAVTWLAPGTNLSITGTTLDAAGGGASMTKAINQTAHGFAVGDVVRISGASTYAKAQANSAANAEVAGIVSAVADANNFTLTTGGEITGLSGLTANTVYFLSPSTAGLLTSTAPSASGQVSKPVFIAYSTTAGYFYNFRGQVLGDPIVATDGWTAAGETWTYASADAPTFTFTVAADVTTKYQAGMRVKLTQTTAKYFIITAVSTFSGGNTTITVYGGTDYTLANAAITSPFWSMMKVPFGFNADPAKWTVTVTDTGAPTKASPTQNTWYGDTATTPTAPSISIPIGCWRVEYQCSPQPTRTSGSNSEYVSLSTSASSESDASMTAVVLASATASLVLTVNRNRTLTLAAKATYYLIMKTDTTSITSINIRGDISSTVIRAVCAYL